MAGGLPRSVAWLFFPEIKAFDCLIHSIGRFVCFRFLCRFDEARVLFLPRHLRS